LIWTGGLSAVEYPFKRHLNASFGHTSRRRPGASCSCQVLRQAFQGRVGPLSVRLCVGSLPYSGRGLNNRPAGHGRPGRSCHRRGRYAQNRASGSMTLFGGHSPSRWPTACRCQSAGKRLPSLPPALQPLALVLMTSYPLTYRFPFGKAR